MDKPVGRRGKGVHMSSAANHRKRSRRSEAMKGGAFNTEARRVYFNSAREYGNHSVLDRLQFYRRARRPREKTAVEPIDERDGA